MKLANQSILSHAMLRIIAVECGLTIRGVLDYLEKYGVPINARVLGGVHVKSKIANETFDHPSRNYVVDLEWTKDSDSSYEYDDSNVSEQQDSQDGAILFNIDSKMYPYGIDMAFHTINQFSNTGSNHSDDLSWQSLVQLDISQDKKLVKVIPNMKLFGTKQMIFIRMTIAKKDYPVSGRPQSSLSVFGVNVRPCSLSTDRPSSTLPSSSTTLSDCKTRVAETVPSSTTGLLECDNNPTRSFMASKYDFIIHALLTTVVAALSLLPLALSFMMQLLDMICDHISLFPVLNLPSLAQRRMLKVFLIGLSLTLSAQFGPSLYSVAVYVWNSLQLSGMICLFSVILIFKFVLH
jgi:hypothetical protein